jgi:RNA polymerase sigma-70 factor (ECF subfamily)
LKLPVPHLVDELAHETFVFAYRNIHKFTPGTSLRAWLRAIAANKIRAEVERYCREQSNRLGYVEHRLIELAAAQPDEQTEREVAAMQECLKTVPDHSRQLLTLKYRDDCSAQEMAERLARSVPWIRTTLFRIREQLRACIETRLAGEQP